MQHMVDRHCLFVLQEDWLFFSIIALQYFIYFVRHADDIANDDTNEKMLVELLGEDIWSYYILVAGTFWENILRMVSTSTDIIWVGRRFRHEKISHL